MATPSLTLPSPSALSTLPAAELQAVLDLLFEHSPLLLAITTTLLSSPTPPASSYPALIDAVGAQLLSLQDSADPADGATLVSVLGAHPRLGEKKRETLSVLSAGEQAQLQATDDKAAAAEADELARLNATYEATFPGLRYVVFVNGRGRPEIFVDMRRRIARGSMAEEQREGVKVCGPHG